MPSRPNILVLMPDQHRADLLGCAGDPVIRTPNIDRLAAEGIRYDNVYCQGPLCMPARASFLTERYVRDHGVYENRWDVPEGMPTFLHSLRGSGYHTACIGKMHLWVHGRHRRGDARPDSRDLADKMIGYGFDEPIETVGKLASVAIGSEYADHLATRGLLDTYRGWVAQRMYGRGVQTDQETLPNWATDSIPLPLEDYIDYWHGDRVVRWIEEYDRDQPWFLWVGFPGPHDPWDAPAEYVDLYREAAMPMPGSVRRPDIPEEGPFNRFLSYWVWTHSDSATLTDERIQEVRRYYYANVSLIDDAVGRIRAALERTGQADDTWIIYTSDHGEMMGEHRMLMKMVFYEPSVKVPLIIRPPGGTAPQVVDDLVEHFDVPATARAIAGAGGDDSFEGRALVGADGQAVVPGRSAVYSENYGVGMVKTDRHKLVFHEDSLEPGQLFDLVDDPHEDNNLIGDPAAKSLLDELHEGLVRPFLAGGRVKPGPGVFEQAGRP
ncbi:MAG TPA: sulfatase-like hydrolase/transferase [Acidimicrobiales bacterium]|nr:sulfatase-like hydrolase/transferase [Acidimicrobiales bacterium]